ncbi:MAG: hypothetical protein ACYCW6_02610 [Candidatus Xenobia bacterium]
MNTLVPEGHQVTLYKPHTGASVMRTHGGVVLVNLPFSDDEPRQTLEDLFSEVEATVQGASAPVCLTQADGVLSHLFAPNDPPVQQVAGLMIWMVQHGCFNGWDRKELQPRLAGLSRGHATVAFVQDVTPAVMDMLRELGWDVRAASGGDCFVEVMRPEGVVLVALLGAPAPAAKPQADEPPLRAGYLQRWLLADDRSELYRVLSERPQPLVLLVDPGTKALVPRRFAEGDAFPAYPDRISAQWALEDRRGTSAFAGISAADLFRWARDADMALALCFYEDRQTARYVFVPLQDVRALTD